MEYPSGSMVWKDDEIGVVVVLTDKYHVYTNYYFLTTEKLVWFHLNAFDTEIEAIQYAKLIKRH